MSSSAPRYTVRAHPIGGHYCVWDNETNAVAASPGGDRRYDDLQFNEAFNAVDELAQSQQQPKKE